MLHKPFIFKQIARSRKQGAVFVLCVVLAIVTLVTLEGLRASVNTAMLEDARSLHAGDIIVRAHYPISKPVSGVIDRLKRQGLIEAVRLRQFYSMVKALNTSKSLLSDLKIVEEGYPFYGKVKLKSERPLKSVLRPGRIIVEQLLLDRLDLKLGDHLQIGKATLDIADILVQEPDRPVNFFSLGPRVLISAADLDALDLLQQGSHIHYTLLVKLLDEKNLNWITAALKAAALDQERVDTYRTASSGVKRFFDNFLFFLNLIGMFTLMLAGFGIRSALSALLRENEHTIAIMKTVGATTRFVTWHYVLIITLLGLLGTFIGLFMGYPLQLGFLAAFSGLLPPDITPTLSWSTILEGLFLGILVVALFAFLPLYRLRELKPGFIFRKEHSASTKGLPYYLSVLTIFAFFSAMVFWQLKAIKIGFLFIAGITGLILAAALVAQLILKGLQKSRLKSLALRQASRGLFRPSNATRSIITTLSASLAVIFAIFLIERNLDAAFVQSYPAETPNLFFIDIQPNQLKKFEETLGMAPRYYPIVRARIVSVNGEKIDLQRERQRKGDNLARDFNLTYRNDLLADEALVKGKTLFRRDLPGIQVSVLDTVVEMKPMAIGDRVVFNIQGVALEATVSSIRTRTRKSIQPFFYFVFPGQTLKDAPQTIFTAIRVPKDQVARIQNKIVSGFPNISVIDITETIVIFARVMHKLSRIVQFFTAFSIVAGLLIIVSSVFATRFARIREAVYFKILGARGFFVLKVFAIENLLLGLSSALLATALSQIGSWIICTRILDIVYKPFVGQNILMVLATVLLVIGIGLFASISILTKKPVIFLRELVGE